MMRMTKVVFFCCVKACVRSKQRKCCDYSMNIVALKARALCMVRCAVALGVVAIKKYT